jgi:enoyl-CoA hydratase/carnithine racemase
MICFDVFNNYFKVNTLSEGMMNEFIPVFNHLKNDDNIKGIVVISTKPGSFIAGADIKLERKIFSLIVFY